MMPKSIESSEFDFSNENQSSLDNRGSVTSIGKKFRHQNYSKNIYIGTKNAEKWELIRSKLTFKNDVEFVCYLLKLAENDLVNNDEKSINDIELYRNNEKSKTGKFFKETTKTSENSNSFISSASKKCKKVHFNETSNGFGAIKLPRSEKSVDTTGGQNFTNYSVLSQNSQDAQDHSQCIDVKCDSSVPEILDCRIAEKIKNELEQKFGLDNGFSGSQPDNLSESDEVLCLATKLNVPTVSNDERPIVEKIKIKNLVAKKKRKSLKDCDKNTKLKNQFRIDLKAGTKKKTKVKGSKKKNDTRKVNKNQSTKTPKDVYKDNTDVTDSLEQTDCNAGSFPKDDDDGVSLEKENLNDDEPQEQIQNDSSSDNCYSPTNEKSCILCLEDHAEEMCPLRNAVDQISDKISFNLWTAENHKINDSDSIGKHSQPLDDDKPLEEDLDHQDIETNDTRKSQNSYANASVPDQFELKQINGQSYGVFAKVMIPKHTKLGPLIGSLVKEVDISDDCNMSYIYESYDGAKSTYFSTEDENTSNWLRFVRPAQVRDIRNVAMIEQDGNIYMVTTMDIEEGCEIIYWSDECNSAWKRKKINKLNCGGCNIKFDHPLNYRTHCSIFHDPKLSLTIRKYHCKICANSFLGKESIMKHAAEMHDGKGAYQCQYCKKFFLRLNYLEMHRTYGCSANPQRTRPLCDFCGRKFCQPQKLKVHIKRMHSDLADVLRDFQCKLCSKLLGSRAALQRHSKEVHSRNSAVVSCPRCQKLFQNRSNLKIHMLTHSGVRPFKCAEVECNAAFTTKQCLQFHYKKVHNYTPEQMPKIERSVAYTFDAYSGGMKSNFVEQTSRRRRKSVDDQNSLIAASMLDDKSDLDEMSDDNSEFKKQESSKTESNFSFLSSKLNSMLLEHGTKRRKRDRKLKEPKLSKSEVSNSTDDILDDMKPNDRDDEMLNSMKQKQQNKQVSLIESLLASTSTRPILDSTDLTTKLPNNELIHDELEKNFKLQTNMIFKPRDIIMNSMQNLVLSKGSKKWISEADDNETDENGDGDEDDDENNEDDTNRNLNCADEKDLSHSNRDFISRLIMNGNQTGEQNDPDDENSSFLDVVDTNNCTQSVGRYPHTTSSTGSMIHADDQLPQMSQIPSHLHSTQNYLNNFYNNVTGNNTRTIPTSSTSTSASASLLVEAALNSVGNMINEDTDKNSNENTSLEGANESNTQIDVPINSIHSNTAHHNNALTSQENRFTSVMNNSLHNIDSDIKMMKGMANFPMQMPSLPMFSGTGTNISSQMDDLSSPNHNQGNLNTNQDNEIDVDSASTPRTMEPPDKMYNEQDPFNSQQDRQPQSPHIISPGRDYGMFNSNNNDIVSPLSSMQRQRSGYTDHELISPASSPAATMPRYDFNNDMYRKRTDNPMSRLINKTDNHHHHQHLSSDEESSIMAQNLSITNHNSNHGETELRMKYNNTQMDLIYNKYDHTNQTDLESTIRNKCIMEHNLDVSNFRNSMANETSIVNTDNMQGLDMTARTNLSGGFHHNFQLPTGNSNLNLGRYHHHIYDILSDREQDHTQLQMQQQQQMQHMLQDSLPNDHDTDQTTSVDLSRSGSYVVASPTSSISHTYSHSDMLRMSSLEIASNSGSMVGSNRSFISSQIQHTNRDSLDHHRYLSSAEQHRLLAGNGSTDQLGANHRLLVDPTAHLLMEQNSRLLSSDQSRLLSEPVQNRHMVASRGFGAYHQGVSTTNYHHGVRAPVLTPPSHHPTNPSNYHPFSSYY